jgi:hypothetical protein
MSDENRIREFAYQIWESEGRPSGHEARHWEMACKLAAAESGQGTLAKPKAPRKPKAAALKGVTEDAPAPVVKARATGKGRSKTKPE